MGQTRRQIVNHDIGYRRLQNVTDDEAVTVGVSSLIGAKAKRKPANAGSAASTIQRC